MSGKSRRTLYLVAGIYVFYLGIKLINSFVKGTGGNPIVSLVGAIFFLGCGGFLIVDYIRKTRNAYVDEQNQKEDVIESEATVVEEEEE